VREEEWAVLCRHVKAVEEHRAQCHGIIINPDDDDDDEDDDMELITRKQYLTCERPLSTP
jgi:hypothetical protein